MPANSSKFLHGIGFELLGLELGTDIAAAIADAVAAGTVFWKGNDPLTIFRQALSTSIRDIESHPRGKLFQEFLRKGPYERYGEIPLALVEQRLSDADTAAVITFIYSFMVNRFKGELAELLAAGACSRLLVQLQQTGRLPANARLYAGDAVQVRRQHGSGYLKGADLAILVEDRDAAGKPVVHLAGVAEVKSYFRSQEKLNAQLGQHIRRSQSGLCVAGVDYTNEQIRIGWGSPRQVLRITILPDHWQLPRTFHYDSASGHKLLYVDDQNPTRAEDEILQIGEEDWKITLRWSKEALAAAAYEMTFWYMEQVGEVIYAQGENKPAEWSEMTSAEAGRNAAKMMLYYAILRCRTPKEQQRAVALYNSYGFGYALGMNFVNKTGRLEMLWPEDLDAILRDGVTKHGGRIRGFSLYNG